jgi:hypothetical protein
MPSETKKPKPLIPMTDIEEKEMTWLWYPYIPGPAATMVFGPGGAGKSHIVVDIASRVSTGEPFPGTDRRRPPEKVLMLSAEDDPRYVLKPRLRKAGANMDNVFIPPSFFTVDTAGLALIDYYIRDMTLGVVFIDPVVSYIGSDVDINKANEVRGFSGGLEKIAELYQIPIIYVHHARKSGEGRDSDKAMGSADFVNGSRSALFVTQAPNGDRIMKHSKTNYAAHGRTMGFEFTDEVFSWTGEYQEDGVKVPGRTGGQKDAVEAWLIEALANGPVAATQMEQTMKAKGFSLSTVNRAKKGLVKSKLVSENSVLKWYWQLAGDSNERTELATAENQENETPVMGARWDVGRPMGPIQRTDRGPGDYSTKPNGLLGRRGSGRTRDTSAVLEPKKAAAGLTGQVVNEEILAKWVKENL